MTVMVGPPFKKGRIPEEGEGERGECEGECEGERTVSSYKGGTLRVSRTYSTFAAKIIFFS